MDLSGVIFVVLALAWAVYLIPKALKHHDEVARSRSIDRFSNAMRVLARRSPGDGAPSSQVPEREPVPSRPVVTKAQRRAAAVAARRRRRILLLLLLADVTVGALVALSVAARWSVAVPAALTLLWLVLCRTQVRSASRARPVEVPRVAARARRDLARPLNDQGFEEVSEDEDTVALDRAEVLAVMAAPADVDGSLWDPLPVTLPTYVTKPRAPRTVRTIDLGAPDTWSSGRDEADSALVAEAAAEADRAAGQAVEAAEGDDLSEQKAVGS